MRVRYFIKHWSLGAMIAQYFPLAQSFFRTQNQLFMHNFLSITLIGLAYQNRLFFQVFFRIVFFSFNLVYCYHNFLQTLPDENQRKGCWFIFYFCATIWIRLHNRWLLGDTIGINPTIYIASSSHLNSFNLLYFSSSLDH